MANIITSCRIICSLVLLFFPAFSPMFYAMYLLAGFSDMIDGSVARRTNTTSVFGSELDTVADAIFVAATLVKLLPTLYIPTWLWIWITVVAIIKITNIISGFVVHKRFVVDHSVMNKVAGFLLFVLPLTLNLVELKYSAIIVCSFTTFAALQEGHFIRTRKYD